MEMFVFLPRHFHLVPFGPVGHVSRRGSNDVPVGLACFCF